MATFIAARDIDPGHLLLDVRLGPTAAAYEEGHLSGAHFVDVEVDLCGDHSDASRGGRHPLPDLGAWLATVARLGIDAHTKVVAYDDASGAKAAARAWWMLRAIGHEHVWVLDGGLDAAIAAGHELTRDVPPRKPSAVRAAHRWGSEPMSIDQVEAVAQDSSWRVLDVRSAERHRGEVEPLDPIPGHIPGALNVPYLQNLDEDGLIRSPDELGRLYASALGATPMKNVVVSCGSGITACHTLLALEHAGLEGARLFPGSYSEWSRSGRPVAAR